MVLLLAGCRAEPIPTGAVLTAAGNATATASAHTLPSATPPRGEPTAVASAPVPTATAVASTPAPPASTPARPPAAPTPSATPAGPAFRVEVEPRMVARGETILIRATGVAEGRVRLAGRDVPLIAGGAGGWAVLGVGLYAPLGATTVAVDGGPAGNVEATITVVDPGRPADYLHVDEATASILTPEAIAQESQQRAQQFARSDPAPRWRTAFRHPVLEFQVSTQFGSGRSVNGGPIGDFHTGEDLAADEGTPVTAAAPGRVAWVGTMPIRGHTVIVDHGAGVMTGYHHLLDVAARVDQPIEAGALLGWVGSTGFSTGPHLHWELTIHGVNVDPETWTARLFAAS